MRKVIVAVLLCLLPSPLYAHTDPQSPIVCHYHFWENKSEVVKQITCLANRIHPPGGARKALRVAGCEARFNHLSGRGTSHPYGSTWQHDKDAWPGRVKRWLGDIKHIRQASLYNNRFATIVAMRMARADGTWSGQWPVCGRR